MNKMAFESAHFLKSPEYFSRDSSWLSLKNLSRVNVQKDSLYIGKMLKMQEKSRAGQAKMGPKEKFFLCQYMLLGTSYKK